MRLILLVFVSAISLLSFADERSELFRDNKLEFMAFGFGLSEGINGLGKPSETGTFKQVEGKKSFPIIQESVPGITSIHVQATPSKPILHKLIVSKPSLQLPSCGRIANATLTCIITWLGPPDYQDEISASYFVPSFSGSDSLEFAVKNGKISEITWEWEIE